MSACVCFIQSRKKRKGFPLKEIEDTKKVKHLFCWILKQGPHIKEQIGNERKPYTEIFDILLFNKLIKMMGKRFHHSTVEDSSADFLKGRDGPPSHLLFKIENFPLLAKASIDKYSSEEFQAGGYSWKVSIYPTGNKSRGGTDHISIFLEIVETSSLPIGWEVKAIFNLFVYGHLDDKYFSVQDTELRRFHSMKTQWGIAKFIDLKTFNNPSNGYLINDTCVFGAEIFIVKNTFEGACLSMIEEPVTSLYTWKVDSFQSKTLEWYKSPLFVGGDYKWWILIYPNGNNEAKGNSISVFLQLDSSTLPPNTKLFVDYNLRMKDQIDSNHCERKGSNVFSSSVTTAWGSRQFMSLAKLNDPKSGYLVGDTCIIEVNFKVLGLVKSQAAL